MLAYQQGRNTTKTEPVGSAITYFVEADPEEADSGADDNTEIAPILVCGNAGCKWDP